MSLSLHPALRLKPAVPPEPPDDNEEERRRIELEIAALDAHLRNLRETEAILERARLRDTA